MGWWNKLVHDAKKCLVCESKCDEVYTTIQYKYENDQLGEVHLCEDCAKLYNFDEHNEIDDE